MSPCSGREGFTLLEVLISIAILGLALIALTGLRDRAITMVERAERLNRAVITATNLMTTLEMAPPRERKAGMEDGYRWEAVVKDGPLQGMKEIVLTLWWEEERLLEVVEYIEG